MEKQNEVYIDANGIAIKEYCFSVPNDLIWEHWKQWIDEDEVENE